jgi:hypothetical protein
LEMLIIALRGAPSQEQNMADFLFAPMFGRLFLRGFRTGGPIEWASCQVYTVPRSPRTGTVCLQYRFPAI